MKKYILSALMLLAGMGVSLAQQTVAGTTYFLPKTALRFADLICEVFGENGKAGYGGHEIAELGMIKLYEATGKEEYLKAARLFVDRRGTKPFYFDIERGITTDGLGYKYNQAHLPVREQNEAVGHAVRGVYLYSAMADLSRLTNDDSMYEACMRIWENITQTST